MELIRAYVRVYGFVQGVFFRAHTRRMAKSLGLKGYVRNMDDGSVEAVFEGEKEKVMEAVKWCHHGPPHAIVVKVDIKWDEYKGEYSDFHILY